MTSAVLGNSLVVLAAIGFWAYCLFDFTRTDELEMRLFSKPVWLVLLVFTSLLGSLMWFFAGRPQRPSPR
jgi:hypothetical protein